MKKVLCTILLSFAISTIQTTDNEEQGGWLARLYSFFFERSQTNQNNDTQEAPINQAALTGVSQEDDGIGQEMDEQGPTAGLVGLETMLEPIDQDKGVTTVRRNQTWYSWTPSQ